MMDRRALTPVFLLLTGMILAAGIPAQAVVTRLYPLAQIIADADAITVAQVTSPRRHRDSVQVTVTGPLKGKPAFTRVPVRLSGGDDATQLPVIRQKLATGKPFVLFIKNGAFALGFSEGSWFRLAAPKGKDPWRFVHMEPYLRRTYRGTTAELEQTIKDALSGKFPAPAPDPNAKPGF